MIRVGDRPVAAIYAGDTAVQAVYVGDERVWPEGGPAYMPCLTFRAEAAFTVYIQRSEKTWDGELEYSLDRETWHTVNPGTSIYSGNGKRVYMRGSGNQWISWHNRPSGDPFGFFGMIGSGVRCVGNIETLLDYRSVAEGLHPAMGGSCFRNLFDGCEALVSTPRMPATTLALYCYSGMYRGCINLTEPPELPATSLAEHCYDNMFYGCKALQAPMALRATVLPQYCYSSMFASCWSLRLSETQTEVFTVPFRIPAAGEAETAASALDYMFGWTGGPFQDTPEAGKTYYLATGGILHGDISFEGKSRILTATESASWDNGFVPEGDTLEVIN